LPWLSAAANPPDQQQPPLPSLFNAKPKGEHPTTPQIWTSVFGWLLLHSEKISMGPTQQTEFFWFCRILPCCTIEVSGSNPNSGLNHSQHMIWQGVPTKP